MWETYALRCSKNEEANIDLCFWKSKTINENAEQLCIYLLPVTRNKRNNELAFVRNRITFCHLKKYYLPAVQEQIKRGGNKQLSQRKITTNTWFALTQTRSSFAPLSPQAPETPQPPQTNATIIRPPTLSRVTSRSATCFFTRLL